MHVLDTEMDLAEGLLSLIAREPRFADIVARHGPPPLRRSPEGLGSLLRIVTDQLISLKAGASIWARLEAALAPFDPLSIATTPEELLLSCGLSRAKARCFRSVAGAVADGSFAFETLRQFSDEDAITALVQLPGVGPWTAKIYLLSAMGRADAWPTGDLALHVAAEDLFALPSRPSAPEMWVLAEPWRPWRSIAARLLWSHYRDLKSMPQMP